MHWPLIILITLVSTFGCIALDQFVNGRSAPIQSESTKTGEADPGMKAGQDSESSRKQR